MSTAEIIGLLFLAMNFVLALVKLMIYIVDVFSKKENNRLGH